MIVLTILKIIGLVLAGIIALVLFLILLVLLTPIRYSLSGDGANQEIEAEAKVKWMLGLLSGSLSYQKKTLPFRVTVFGIPIKKGDLMEVVGSSDEKKKEEKEHHQLAVDGAEELQKKETERVEAEEIEKPEESRSLPTELEVSKKKKEKEDLSDRIEHFCEKITAKLDKFQKKLEDAERIVTSDVTKRAVKTVKEQLFRILNHIKPKKISGNLNFGLEDPANTAIIYGTIDILAESMSDGKLIITPEFYQPGIALDMSIHGRIFLGVIALCAVKVLFNKDVKRVIRAIRRVM